MSGLRGWYECEEDWIRMRKHIVRVNDYRSMGKTASIKDSLECSHVGVHIHTVPNDKGVIRIEFPSDSLCFL